MCCNRRLRGTGRALARRRVSAQHRRRDDVLPRLFSVARLRRRRLRQRRQLVLVPRGAGDVQPRRRGAFHAADTPQTRLLYAVVTSRAHLLAGLEEVIIAGEIVGDGRLADRRDDDTRVDYVQCLSTKTHA